MNNDHRTPYEEDALRVENGTQPEEVQAFVKRRALRPYEFDGVVIWDFNNHALNVEQLEKQVDDFMNDRYVIPYQASGVWGYMVSLLPSRVKEAEILTYSQTNGEYNPYPNYFRHSADPVNDGIRQEISDRLEERGL